MALFITLASGLLLVLLTVGTHLLALRGLTALLLGVRHRPFLGVGLVIVLAIFAHLVEISLFAVALGALTRVPDVGAIVGADLTGWHGLFYYSAVTFTSLGYGDYLPTEHLRLFAGIEALTGLVLITWTASFTFLAMQRLWGNRLDQRLQ